MAKWQNLAATIVVLLERSAVLSVLSVLSCPMIHRPNIRNTRGRLS